MSDQAKRRSRWVSWALVATAAATAGQLVGAAPANAAEPMRIFAAPSGTGSTCSQADPCALASAVEKERAAAPGMSSDIVVYLRGGRYPISSPIVLGSDDSGRNGHRVIFRNYPDESPVLSGGELITGWTRDSDGLWTADANGRTFFQLYGDGVRFTRARTEAVKGRRWKIKGSRALKVRVPASIVPSTGIADLTGVQVRIMHTWRELRYPVADIKAPVDGRRFVKLKEPISKWSDHWAPTKYGLNPKATATKRFGPVGETYLAGAREFLDQDGEWYLDSATDTVYLKSTVDPDTLHVTAPVTEKLLEIDGASHVTIYGLQFAHSAWNGPLFNGNIQRQGGVHMTYDPKRIIRNHPVWYPNPAAVRIGSATDIRFQRNGFRDTGANAVDLDPGTTTVRFIANIFTQISDTGLFVGTGQDPWAPQDKRNVNTIVKNNYFSRMGQTYATDSAITMSYPQGATIAHNDIENVHNIGINMGYFNGFGAEVATDLRNVHVTANRIDHVCITARDCGGWHSVGNYVHGDVDGVSVPRSTVSRNYVTDIHANPLSGGGRLRALYVDGSSNGLGVTDNEWDDVPQGMKVSKSAGDDLVLEPNDTGDAAVIDNAGLVRGYRFLRNIDLATDSVGASRGPHPDV